ncbi:helix-turn-helix domain-containing protein [Bacillus cytotoxicus]|uniref:Helix-turn-helix domain-containing protein n=1 Tax=Bacillus cytotoxicus TaxID=580165 RepID=A0ACC6A705_9BACI|nr:helix-turn-helix domain-containing protein [Bacillus cytotoxicus]
MNIGERLKFLRNRRGWTIQDTAEKVGISDSTYGGYETNYRKPNLEVLCRLADILNSTTDFILGRTDNQNGFDFDMKDMLEQGKLNWDGRELNDEEAEKVVALLQIVMQRKLDKQKRISDKC